VSFTFPLFATPLVRQRLLKAGKHCIRCCRIERSTEKKSRFESLLLAVARPV
jgi:hypothetical protein